MHSKNYVTGPEGTLLNPQQKQPPLQRAGYN